MKSPAHALAAGTNAPLGQAPPTVSALPLPHRPPFRKLLVVVEDLTVHAYLIKIPPSDQEPRAATVERCRPSALHNCGATGPEEPVARLALQIGGLIARENPMIWNLLAPTILLDLLIAHLDLRAKDRLTLCEEWEGDATLDDEEIRRRYLPMAVCSLEAIGRVP